jgi:hypothetical protein
MAARFMGNKVADRAKHCRVFAKHFREAQGGADPLDFYSCAGVEGDTGGCNALITGTAWSCSRPAWAEYPDAH